MSGRRQFYALFHNQEGAESGLVHFGDDAGTLVHFDFVQKQGDFPERKTIERPILLDHWYKIWIKVRGREIWIYLDDEETFHCVRAPFTRGRVGFATWQTQALFSDISVTTPDGKEIWNGLPELPGEEKVTVTPAPSVGRPSEIFGNAARGPADSPPVLPVTKLSGEWKVEGDELVERGGGGEVLLGDTSSLSHYDLRFKGQIMSGSEGFNALFHRTSPDNFRFFHVGERAGESVVAGLVFEGKEGGRSKPFATIKGRWYDVLVKARGPECWSYLDGKELFHEVNTHLSKGRIGLATWAGDARYRDIRVTTPEGNPLWGGPPKLRGK